MLTQELLKDILDYNPETGVFIWKKKTSYRVSVGGVAGSLNKKDGYIRIFISSKSYLAHRLAFLYVTGNAPESEIDHVDHDRSNNKWVNLRQVSKTENMRNISGQRNNVSGVTGVYWNKDNGKWAAQIKVGGRNKRIGLFDIKEDAVLARAKANADYGFHVNHGAFV